MKSVPVISSIADGQCAPLSEKFFTNSCELWSSGMQLMATQKFGPASFLLVAGNKELITSIILLCDSRGFKFRKLEQIDTILEDDQLNFFIAFLFLLFSLFKDELFAFLKMIKSEKSKFYRLAETLNSDAVQAKKIGFNYFRKKAVALQKEYNWFTTTEIFKNQTLYFNPGREDNKAISKKDFNEVFSRLEKVRSGCLWIRETFLSKDPELAKNMESLKTDFIEKGYYQKIDASLLKLNQTNGNPFDRLKDLFTN